MLRFRRLSRWLAATLVGLTAGVALAATTVSTSFTAVGTGSSLLVRHGETLSYAVSGTFAGTVHIDRSRNGGLTWEPVVANITSATSGTLLCETPNRRAANYRVRCSTITSGTIVTALSEGVDAFAEFKSPANNVVLKLVEDAIAAPVKVFGTGTTNAVEVSTHTSGSPIAFKVVNDGSLVFGSTTTVGAQFVGCPILPSNPAPRTNVTPPGAYSLIVNSTVPQICWSTGTAKTSWCVWGSSYTACAN